MNSEPESLMLRLLHEMRAEMADLRGQMAAGSDIADLQSDMTSLRADVAADFMAFQAKAAEEHKQTREQIVGLRHAVIEYHTSVIGRGILISELEARVRRVEQHLDLPSLDAN